MGGKGGSGSDDSSAMMMMLMQNMMSSQQSALPEMPEMSTSFHQPSTPEVIPTPEVEEIEPIDWTERASQAAANAKADQLLDQTRRARVSFLEDDELEVTDSILAGE